MTAQRGLACRECVTNLGDFAQNKSFSSDLEILDFAGWRAVAAAFVHAREFVGWNSQFRNFAVSYVAATSFGFHHCTIGARHREIKANFRGTFALGLIELAVNGWVCNRHAIHRDVDRFASADCHLGFTSRQKT